MTSTPSTTTPSVLVVVNSRQSGPRRLETWWREAGLQLDIVFGGDGLPESLEQYDGLVMLGGGLMPDDYDKAPWLHQERVLAAQAIATDTPTLGICLGGQLLADVAQGEVRRDYGTPERGATKISITAAGAADPLISAFAPESFLMENHQDMITALPPGAVLLADSVDCPHQAFRIGERVWGLQFHPEVNAAELTKWDDAALAQQGLSLDALVTDALIHDVDSERRCAAMAAAFAAQVTGYRSARTS